ncbi:BnaA02g17070D [Brassica napus]|uniref:BnaA02g17070D protein n=1 Tax=Brassica napus TaxID=3708 RepID=A0A078I9H1_BRANA|nr:BnaA02g17070D [Brassica napus]
MAFLKERETVLVVW